MGYIAYDFGPGFNEEQLVFNRHHRVQLHPLEDALVSSLSELKDIQAPFLRACMRYDTNLSAVLRPSVR